jgi:integrase/recombinase XerC
VNSEQLLEAMLSRGYSRKTCHHYVNTIRRFKVLCERAGVDLDVATAIQISTLSANVRHSGSSRNLLRSALGAYYKCLGRFDSPHLAVFVPKRAPMRCRALSDSDAARLAHHAAASHDAPGLAVLLGLYCGLRRGEIAALRVGDLSNDGWATVTGKGRTRQVPVPALVRIRWIEVAGPRYEHARLFAGRWGEDPCGATIWNWVREVSIAAGIGTVATHVLRHTALATALDNSHDIRAVQELAGHADPNTTAGYTRVKTDRLVAVSNGIKYGVE